MTTDQLRSLGRLEKNAAHDGKFLAGWLNEESAGGFSKRAQRNIASLLDQLLSLKNEKSSEKYQKALVPINAVLARYPRVFQFMRTVRRGIPVPGFVERPARTAENAYWALGIVIWLARMERLDRVRRCETCKIWFYAVVPKARFHSGDCRQAHHRATPEYREKNREYQRKYYRDILSPKTAKHLKGRGGRRNAKKK